MSKRSDSVLAAQDRMQAALLKAKSLSLVTYGEQGETFRSLKDDDQEVILWTLSDLVCEAFAASEQAMAGGDK